jgi:hypothetical protein
MGLNLRVREGEEGGCVALYRWLAPPTMRHLTCVFWMIFWVRMSRVASNTCSGDGAGDSSKRDLG